MGVSSSESHDLTAFYEMLSASFGVLSQNTGFYPSLDRIIETTLGPLNLGPGGGSYNEPISRLQRTRRMRHTMTGSTPWGTSSYTTFSTNVPIHHHGDTYPQLSLYVQLGLHPHPRLRPHHPLPGGLSVGCCFYEGLGHWLGVGGSFRSTLGSLRPLSGLCPLGKYQIFFSFFFTWTTCKIFCEYFFNLFLTFSKLFSNLTLTCIYMFFLLSHGLQGLSPKGGALSQLAMDCVTCHACHGCVMDFRPILGNPMEVAHVTSPGHVYIFPR